MSATTRFGLGLLALALFSCEPTGSGAPVSTPSGECGLRPAEGCPCEGEGSVECGGEPVESDGGVLCRVGVRTCRDGAWSACEDMEERPPPEDADEEVGRASEPLITGPETCSPCDPSCRTHTDRPNARDLPGRSRDLEFDPGAGGVGLEREVSICRSAACETSSSVGPGTGMPWMPTPDNSEGVVVDPADGALTLGFTTVSSRGVWIASMNDGTVSRLDPVTAREVARYPTARPNAVNRARPWNEACNWSNRGNCPSRTAVDQNYDVYVANRAFGNQGTVTKIAGAITGCRDRNGDGVIQTSRDINGNGRIDMGTAEFVGPGDECLLWTMPVGRRNGVPRALTVGVAPGASSVGDVWVGMYNTQRACRMSPTTGATLGCLDLSTPASTRCRTERYRERVRVLVRERVRVRVRVLVRSLEWVRVRVIVGYRTTRERYCRFGWRGRCWFWGYRWVRTPIYAYRWQRRVVYRWEWRWEWRWISRWEWRWQWRTRTICETTPGQRIYPYGAVTDPRGRIWFASRRYSRETLGHVDPATMRFRMASLAPTNVVSYGISAWSSTDLSQVYVFVADSNQNAILRYDPDRDRWFRRDLRSVGLYITPRGIAADEDHLWVANWSRGAGWRGGCSNNFYRLRLPNLDAPRGFGSGAAHCQVGIGVGYDGAVWSVSQGTNNVMRLAPDRRSGIVTPRIFVTPYTYSDFVGFGLNTFANPRGHYAFTTDSGSSCTTYHWTRLDWRATTPPGTSVELWVRSADTRAGLATRPWIGPFVSSPANLAAAPGPVPDGRYLETDVRLATTDRSTTPRVYDVSATGRCDRYGYVPSGSYERTYDTTSVCARNERPTWGDLRFSVRTPSDSSITFEIRTADDVAGLARARPINVRVPSARSPVDLDARLAREGMQLARVLGVTAVLRASSDRLSSPILHEFSLDYTCHPTE